MKGWLNFFFSFILALLTSLKLTWSQNNLQTDPIMGVGRKAWKSSQIAWMPRVASWCFSKTPDTHAISAAPRGHMSGFWCLLYKETYTVIQLGITLERSTPKRWWKTRFLKDWTIRFFYFSEPRDPVIVR